MLHYAITDLIQHTHFFSTFSRDGGASSWIPVLISPKVYLGPRPSASSSHRWVAWHPDGQDHYSNLLSMRLLTVQSPVLPGSWCWSFWIPNCCRHTDLPRWGSFVVLALPSMRLIQAEPEDCCIHQVNGSDFGWKGGWKNEKNFGIAEKSVLSCTKKHHTNG